MPYSVQELADLAGVTTRTLHYYDEIGLLNPCRNPKNGYREYGEAELLRLQQIMLYRELEVSLDEIKEILDNPDFDIESALEHHRTHIELKRARMDELLETIDKTIKSIKREKAMDDKDLYGGFTKEEYEAYSKEAEERWGHTKAYKQSAERYGKLTKEDRQRMMEESDALMRAFVACMDKSPESPEAQALIEQHYESLRAFYDPNPELYRELVSMYVEDPRFRAFFENYHKDLPEFIRDAGHIFCDNHR